MQLCCSTTTRIQPFVASACVILGLIFGIVAGVTPLAVSIADQRGPKDVIKTLDMLHTCTYRQDPDGDRSVAACIPLGHSETGCFEMAVRARVQQGLTGGLGLTLVGLVFFVVVDSVARFKAPELTLTFGFRTNTWVLALSVFAVLLAAATTASGAMMFQGEFCGQAPFTANPNFRYGPSLFCTLVVGVLSAADLSIASVVRSQETKKEADDNESIDGLQSPASERFDFELKSRGVFPQHPFSVSGETSIAMSPTEPINHP